MHCISNAFRTYAHYCHMKSIGNRKVEKKLRFKFHVDVSFVVGEWASFTQFSLTYKKCPYVTAWLFSALVSVFQIRQPHLQLRNESIASAFYTLISFVYYIFCKNLMWNRTRFNITFIINGINFMRRSHATEKYVNERLTQSATVKGSLKSRQISVFATGFSSSVTASTSTQVAWMNH